MGIKNVKIDWINHLVGLLGVLFGVLIAFWLSNWSDEKRAEATLEVALVNIKSEVSRNDANLDTIFNNNLKLYEFLGKYLKSVDAEMNVTATDQVWKSLQRQYPEYLEDEGSEVRLDLDLFQLSDVAWSAAHRTDAFSSMDYNLAFALEKSYDLQARLSEFDGSLINDLKGINNTRESFLNLYRTLGFALGIATNLREDNYTELMQMIDQYLE
ncbi:MAG: hypothetical protein RLN86_05390 [Cyclobacteriaceae bacterium]